MKKKTLALFILLELSLFSIIKCEERKVCALGMYLDQSGGCQSCGNGNYCVEDSTAPKPCPPGSFSFNGSTGNNFKCEKCPLGSYSDVYGTSDPNCKKCGSGNFCCDPSQSPKKCPSGTESSNENSPSCSLIPKRHNKRLFITQTTTKPNLSKCNFNNANDDALNCALQKTNWISNPDYLASVGDCDFYKEIERRQNCSSQGYLIKYGMKYCKKFGDFSNYFDQDVKKKQNQYFNKKIKIYHN